MTFSSETEISLCDEDETSLEQIPTVTFNFLQINQLENHPPNSIIGFSLSLSLSLSLSVLTAFFFQVDLGYPVPECLHSGFRWS